jgi:hypothetical protein
MKLWFFKVVKCSSIEDVNGLSVVFTIFSLKNGLSKLFENGNLGSFMIGVLKKGKRIFQDFFYISFYK